MRLLPFVLLGLLACQGAQTRVPTTRLVLEGSPKDASVIVDEQPIGSLEFVGSRGVALPKGTHRVTVQADGYFPADLLVEAHGGGVEKRTVNLTALPEP